MDESLFKTILLQGTQLILKVTLKKICIEDFLKQYNNFYYYNALDGHEANDVTISLFHKYADVINLHKDIQTKVIDLIYLEKPDAQSNHLIAGRISIDNVLQQINRIMKSHNISMLLTQVECCVEEQNSTTL